MAQIEQKKYETDQRAEMEGVRDYEKQIKKSCGAGHGSQHAGRLCGAGNAGTGD